MNTAIPVTVTVWPISLSAGRLEALRRLLSADERDRAEKMRPDAARELVAGRGIARELLASICGVSPRAIGFRTSPRGKPFLEGTGSNLAFNLSHSGGYCVLATGEVPRIGVDIEALRATIDDLATKIFSARELDLYAAMPPGDRTRAFFRSWVAKEAYLKATGDGLAGGLKSLETEPAADAVIRPMAIGGDASALRAWQFRGFDVTDGIVGAVAIEVGSRGVEISVRHIDPERPAFITP